MTSGTGLKLSYRRGRILAGYVTLSHGVGKRAARSKKTAEGLVIDYDEGDGVIGIEIPSPCPSAVDALLRLMEDLGVPNAEQEVRPLRRELAPA